MGSIAERAGFAGLAAAEIRLACLCCHMGGGSDAGALMGAVAEGLTLGPATGAPVIGGSGFHIHGVRGLLSDDGISHERCPEKMGVRTSSLPGAQ